MPLSVDRFRTFEGYAVLPEDIQFNEIASQDVTLNQNGVLVPAKLRRWGVTVILRGLNEPQVRRFVREAEQNQYRMIRGSITGDDLNFGTRTILQAVLVNATPSSGIAIGNHKLIEAVQLEYHSLVFV